MPLNSNSPLEIYSTTFPSVKPPLHSNNTPPFPFLLQLSFNLCAATLRPSGRKLSNITISAPASTASSASSSLPTSTSILMLKPPTFLAAFTALVIDPMDQIWLSLSIIIELRSYRCASQPPTNIPYFSTIRKPGVVLRVPARMPL